MAGWEGFRREHAYDTFWADNNPAFHAYDYGANIKIEVPDTLGRLERETRLRPVDEADGEDVSEEAGSEAGSQEDEPGPSTERDTVGSQRQQEDEEDVADDGLLEVSATEARRNEAVTPDVEFSMFVEEDWDETKPARPEAAATRQRKAIRTDTATGTRRGQTRAMRYTAMVSSSFAWHWKTSTT